MNVLRTVIVDDEVLVLQLLKNLLRQEHDIQLVGEFTSPRQALHEIPALQPDLIFLDIEMPGINGIELAIQLLNIMEHVRIVFVTAYDQYAVQAFRLNAMHYILKPPSADDLRQVIQRAMAEPGEPPVRHLDAVYVRLLGGLQINGRSGAALQWPTAKAEELFALFILHGRKGLDKWTIIEKLWPDAPSGKQEQLLYSTVYRLKKTLSAYGIPVCVINKLGVYWMEVKNLWLDVEAFESLYRTHRERDAAEDGFYEQLTGLYTGRLLGSRHYPWCELYQHELARKLDELLTACEAHCRTHNICLLREVQAKRSLLDE